jgi:transposase InsO family protein
MDFMSDSLNGAGNRMIYGVTRGLNISARHWLSGQISTTSPCLYLQPGKPTQNAYIERFNRTDRHEWLELHLFESVEYAQLLATQWPWLYNNERPHSAIGCVPPRQLFDCPFF